MDGRARLSRMRPRLLRCRLVIALAWVTPGLVIAFAWLGACGAARLQPLPAGASAPGPAAGMGRGIVAARGALTYAVAFAGPAGEPSGDRDVLASVELATEFELVIRELDRSGQPRVRQRIRLGPPEFDVGDLAVDRTRGEAWIASRDGTVRSYDLTQGALALTWHLGSPATAVAISADGRLVATGTADGVLCLRRRADSALLQCVVAHEASIAALDFTDAGPGRLASAAWDGTVIVWDVPSLAIAAQQRFDGSVNDVAFTPDGAALALARSASPPVRTPATRSREPRSSARRTDALISLWNVRGRTLRHLRGHGDVVTAVAWVADGRGLVSASWDRSVRLWDMQTGAPVARHTGFAGLVRDVAVDARGAWVAAGAWSDARRLQESTATTVIELLYPTRSRSTVQAGD
jgi:hypothetical protein